MKPNHHSHSTSILTLQKTLQSPHNPNPIPPNHHPPTKFIPFLNERHLGKLILPPNPNPNPNTDPTKNKYKKVSIDDINFKNFKKIYKRELGIENQRYSRMTRNSEQVDLIGDRDDWKVNRIASLSTLRHKHSASSTHKQERPCCTIPPQITIKKPQKFDKIDQDIYKKISISKPPEHLKNPQVTTFFQHYVSACQMNENIRRRQLTTKIKY